jgi:hypothetical protein
MNGIFVGYIIYLFYGVFLCWDINNLIYDIYSHVKGKTSPETMVFTIKFRVFL